MDGIQWKEVNERKRTYHYGGDETLVLQNVTRIEVRDSGTHRLETADGRKLFVRPEWLWIEIDTDDWVF